MGSVQGDAGVADGFAGLVADPTGDGRIGLKPEDEIVGWGLRRKHDGAEEVLVAVVGLLTKSTAAGIEVPRSRGWKREAEVAAAVGVGGRIGGRGWPAHATEPRR